jgi:tetratricopeptide (TPR) repeat protein
MSCQCLRFLSVFNLQVLVSTRLITLDTMRGITIGPLQETEAFQLLRGQTKSLLEEELRKVAERLGYLTLALSVSSRMLAEGVLPHELLQKLDSEGVAQVFKQELEFNEQCPDLVRLFDISLSLVRKHKSAQSQFAEKMLKVGGWFESAPIPLDLLGCAAAKLDQSSNDGEGISAVRLLVRYGLCVRSQDGGVSFHQLVQAYGRLLGGEVAGKAMIEGLKDLGSPVQHAAHFQNACNIAIPPRQMPEIHLGVADEISVIEKICIPLVVVFVRETIQLQTASELLEKCTKAIPVDRKDSQLQATLLTCQARVLNILGRYEDSLSSYKQALKIVAQICVHRGVRCNSCQAYPLRGPRYRSEEQADFDLCEACKTVYSNSEERFTLVDHPSIGPFLRNMAGQHENLGEYEEALPLFERALHIEEKALGPSHLQVATTLNNMTSLLQNLGKHDEALLKISRALQIYEIVLGPDHLDVATGLHNKASLLRIEGRYEEALLLFKRALSIIEKARGVDHISVADTLDNMAGLLEIWGKFDEALPLFQRALDIKTNGLGPDHPDLAFTLNNMASLLHAQGKYEEARLMYQRALSVGKKALGPDHPLVATIMDNVGGLERQGKGVGRKGLRFGRGCCRGR